MSICLNTYYAYKSYCEADNSAEWANTHPALWRIVAGVEKRRLDNG